MNFLEHWRVKSSAIVDSNWIFQVKLSSRMQTLKTAYVHDDEILEGFNGTRHFEENYSNITMDSNI